jgi:hypothetical protein
MGTWLRYFGLGACRTGTSTGVSTILEIRQRPIPEAGSEAKKPIRLNQTDQVALSLTGVAVGFAAGGSVFFTSIVKFESRT